MAKKHQTTLREQLAEYRLYKRILASNDDMQWCHGFYDWFCQDTALERKAKSLMAKVNKFVAANPDIDQNRTYVFFKNNCPVGGPLYDDFRICDRETGDVIYTVVPRCSHSGKAEVWGQANGFNGPLRSAAKLDEILSDRNLVIVTR